MSTPAIKVLGTYGVRSHGVYVTPASRMVRGLIAVFASNANRRVSSFTLCDALWENPSKSAHANLRTHIAQLRSLLRGHLCSITTHRGAPGAYSLQVTSEQLDLSYFRYLIQNARSLRSTRVDEAMALYESALDLWWGDHEGTLPGTVAMRTLTTDWSLEYGRALETYADLAIAQGRTGKLLSHRYAHTMRHPDHSSALSRLEAAIAADGRTTLADLPADLMLEVYTSTGDPRTAG